MKSGIVTLDSIRADFESLMGDPAYPCIAAYHALKAGDIHTEIYGSMGTQQSTLQLADALTRFSELQIELQSPYLTYVAAFSASKFLDELSFENALWSQLQMLHDTRDRSVAWDPQGISDPSQPDFSFSFGGQSFFVVGLHPQASRKARQFKVPFLAFNLASQFRELERKGIYEKMKNIIREKDRKYQGSVSPTILAYGDTHEALLYSGRDVDASWKCPFRP